MSAIQRIDTRRDAATGVLVPVAVMATGERKWGYHNPAIEPEEECDTPVCRDPAHYRLRPYRYDSRYGWVES